MIAVNETSFDQEVLASPVPVLINFWAPWCGVCRLINPLLSQVNQFTGNGVIKVVSINADENFKLANGYRLRTLPTLLLVKEGNVCDLIEGFSGRDELRLALEQMSHQCHLYSAFPSNSCSTSAVSDWA